MTFHERPCYQKESGTMYLFFCIHSNCWRFGPVLGQACDAFDTPTILEDSDDDASPDELDDLAQQAFCGHVERAHEEFCRSGLEDASPPSSRAVAADGLGNKSEQNSVNPEARPASPYRRVVVRRLRRSSQW